LARSPDPLPTLRPAEIGQVSREVSSPKGHPGERYGAGVNGELIVTCACGLEIRGPADQIVARVRQHGRDLHNMDVTDEQALAMARPAPAAGDGPQAP
jgi:hypothetical protein